MVVDAPNSNGPFQPVALMHFRGRLNTFYCHLFEPEGDLSPLLSSHFLSLPCLVWAACFKAVCYLEANVIC